MAVHLHAMLASNLSGAPLIAACLLVCLVTTTVHFITSRLPQNGDIHNRLLLYSNIVLR